MMPLGKTKLNTVQPWGLFTPYGHQVLCADGRIRSCRLASTPDTFFSTPASIKYKGKTVSGYVTTEEEHKAPYRRAYVFRAHTKHLENGTFPFAWPHWLDDAERHLALISAAY